jgi:hypothetical protein
VFASLILARDPARSKIRDPAGIKIAMNALRFHALAIMNIPAKKGARI